MTFRKAYRKHVRECRVRYEKPLAVAMYRAAYEMNEDKSNGSDIRT